MTDSLYNSALGHPLEDTAAEVRHVIDGVNDGRGTIGKLVTDDTL